MLSIFADVYRIATLTDERVGPGHRRIGRGPLSRRDSELADLERQKRYYRDLWAR
jgi:hypothetical protein